MKNADNTKRDMTLKLDLSRLKEPSETNSVMISVRLTKAQHKGLVQHGNMSKIIRFLVDEFLNHMEKTK